MSCMNFDCLFLYQHGRERKGLGLYGWTYIDSRLQGTFHSSLPILLELLNLIQGHSPWLTCVVAERQVTDPDYVIGPSMNLRLRISVTEMCTECGAAYLLNGDSLSVDKWSRSANLSPGVGQLNTDFLILAIGKLDYLRERLDLAILSQAMILGSDSTFRNDSGCFDHCHSGTALNNAT